MVMPRIHTATFEIRHYECDPYGHVNNANYLRYMQEAAFGASAAVGYSTTRYAEMGLAWMAYDTDIEYLKPLKYGDTLTIQTWVKDFRRVRSLRYYELFRQDGTLVARATTDWVLINTEKQLPVSIPPEVVSAYSEGEAPIREERRRVLPVVPQPETGVFKLRRRVEWRDIDPVGHVNNAVYLSYVTDCGMQIARAYGWSMDRLKALGYGNIAFQHAIEYRAGAVCDDELEISTWLSHLKGTSAIRHCAIHRVNDGKLIARARTLGVWVDLATGRPARIPDAYKEDFAPNIAPHE